MLLASVVKDFIVAEGGSGVGGLWSSGGLGGIELGPLQRAPQEACIHGLVDEWGL